MLAFIPLDSSPEHPQAFFLLIALFNFVYFFTSVCATVEVFFSRIACTRESVEQL